MADNGRLRRYRSGAAGDDRSHPAHTDWGNIGSSHCARRGVHPGGVALSPTCDRTRSDYEEPDDFVQRQLLLSTALGSYFGVDETDCRTFFRDDRLGLGLFIARGGDLMQALCSRPDPRAPWRLIDLRQGPCWTSYREDPDVGVQASEEDHRQDAEFDPVRHAVLDGVVYTIRWDVRRPTATSER